MRRIRISWKYAEKAPNFTWDETHISGATDIYFDVCIHSFNPFGLQLSSEVGRWNKSRLVHMIFIVRIGNIALYKPVSTTLTESTESLYTNKNRLSFRHSEKN